MKQRWTKLLLLFAALMGTAFAPPRGLLAAPNPPPGPDRFTVITVEYTAYSWWMAAWKGSQVVCSIVIDHEGPPTPDEAYWDCGEDIYEEWIVQEPCIKQKTNTCEGYYIYSVPSEVTEKEIPTQLPEAAAWLSLEDCEPVSSASTNICETIPRLVITGQEPLPNESITGIEGPGA